MLELEDAALKVVDDRQVELSRAHRLDHVGIGSVFDRGPSKLGVVDPRNHHHGCIGTPGAELLEQPVSGLVRKPYVEQGQGVVGDLEQPPRVSRCECDI